jgi:hypothetical protein
MNKLKLGLMMLVVLLFGGAMAQTQAAQPQLAALPALQTLVLPQGVELSDEELAKVEGELFWKPIVAYYGVRAAIGAVAGGATAGWNSYANTGQVNWKAVAGGAAIGAAAGAAAGWVQIRFPAPPRPPR